jgi:hypothetical protein
MVGARVLLSALAVLLAASLLPPPAAAQSVGGPLAVRLPADVTAIYYAATGHNVRGAFMRHWWTQGQLPIFGFPISDEIVVNGRTVQYFERARFEYYPELTGTPYEVQLGLLGRQVADGRREAAFEPVPPIGESVDISYFEATGHMVGHGFKSFWEAHQGLYNFGYPISEEFVEDGRTVQYFERARFEYHPELVGTPYAVQLGHLGRQMAAAASVNGATAAPLPGAIHWTAHLADELARRTLAEVRQAALRAVPEPIETFQAAVNEPSTTIHRAPTVIGARVQTIYDRHIVQVVGIAQGEPIDGDERWYQLAPGDRFIPAAHVDRFTPPTPPRTWPGRWIDVNLSTFYITGYEGDRPIYSALITAGREGRTPVGTFAVQYRVRSETMDSATVGFPKGHREYYYLENVEYVQYFLAGGFAIHGNYWVHPSRFGRFSSNGCVGLLNADAAWFWSFATYGTPINIHF